MIGRKRTITFYLKGKRIKILYAKFGKIQRKMVVCFEFLTKNISSTGYHSAFIYITQKHWEQLGAKQVAINIITEGKLLK